MRTASRGRQEHESIFEYMHYLETKNICIHNVLVSHESCKKYLYLFTPIYLKVRVLNCLPVKA